MTFFSHAILGAGLFLCLTINPQEPLRVVSAGLPSDQLRLHHVISRSGSFVADLSCVSPTRPLPALRTLPKAFLWPDIFKECTLLPVI